MSNDEWDHRHITIKVRGPKASGKTSIVIPAIQRALDAAGITNVVINHPYEKKAIPSLHEKYSVVIRDDV